MFSRLNRRERTTGRALIIALLFFIVGTMVVGLPGASGAFASTGAPGDEVVNIPDPNLEAAIREALGIGPDVNIYRSELEELTELWAPLTDLSPLANLTKLTELYLGWNQITDISPLSNLTNLSRLCLLYDQVSDISPLVANEGLSRHDVVEVSGNPLNEESINTYIPLLRARGVRIGFRAPDAPVNWWVIGGVAAAAVVLVGLGMLFLVKRRRGAQQG